MAELRDSIWSGEFWWLALLEAALFFSGFVWEPPLLIAPPDGAPWQFFATIMAAATVAMLSCHVGPALLSAQLTAAAHCRSNDEPASRTGFLLRLGGWRILLWLPALWLATGYVWHAYTLVDAISRTSTDVFVKAGTLLVVPIACLLALAAFTRTWWRPAALLGLLAGIGLLAWALPTQWHGVWVANRHGRGWPIEDWLPQVGWRFFLASLCGAAPVFLIAWRMGRIESNRGRLWVSGSLGVWLPLILSLTAASLATRGGLNLYWRPSLPSGFYWSLQGKQGLEHTGLAVEFATIATPFLVCAISLKELVSAWTRWKKLWLLPITVGLWGIWPLIVRAFSNSGDGLRLVFEIEKYQAWAAVVIAIGVGAGFLAAVAMLVTRRTPRNSA